MKETFEKVGDVFTRNGKVWKVRTIKQTNVGPVAHVTRLK